MKRLRLIFAVILCFPILPSYALINANINSYKIEEFIEAFNQCIENKDFNTYKKAFSSDLENIEVARLENFFNEFSMSSVSVESISINKQDPYRPRVYLTLLFQNSYSLILDTWQLDIVKVGGYWRILNKDTIGQTQILYKLEMPSERKERVKRVEVKHKDISISFRDPVVFYDNIPEIETCLILIGKGTLEFTPSLHREQHNLELLNNDRSLKSSIDSLYLRFSPGFFKGNIKIVRGAEEAKLVEDSEIDLAREIFMKNYPRSFTVRSSLTHDFFSVLPQGEEVAFEFKDKKMGELTYIFSPFAFEEINLYQWKNEKIICLYSPPMEGEGKRLFVSFGQKCDVKDYQLDVHYNPRDNHFSGMARITFESKVGRLSSIKLILNPELKILRINDKGQNRLFFSQDDFRKTVYVYLLDQLASGELGEIDIYYRGKLPPLKGASDTSEALQSESKIEFVETEDKFYLYSRTSYWYPAPSEEDYFTARLKLVLPFGYSAVSNGRLVNDFNMKRTDDAEGIDENDRSVYIFEIKNQIKYLSFITGRLEKEGEHRESIPIDYYRGPRTQAYTGHIFKTAEEVVDFYQRRFGPYPFDKLSIVRNVGMNKGGLSPPALVVINDLPRMSGVSSRRMTRSPVDLSRWDEYFLAHEIAHQWWGQGVSWESYHDQWISEGLAQFSASLFLREKYGEDSFGDILKKYSTWTKKKSEWGSIMMGSRISHLDFEAYQSIIYNKTALVLNMLKDMLGDEMFYLGMQRFFLRNKYSAANTKSFINIFNELAENDLDDFFDGWFRSYRLPDVKVMYSVEKNSTGFLLRLNVIQDDRFFMFPLWLEWKENGNRVKKKILADKKVVSFEFKMKHKPKKIRINPYDAVPGWFHIQKS